MYRGAGKLRERRHRSSDSDRRGRDISCSAQLECREQGTAMRLVEMLAVTNTTSVPQLTSALYSPLALTVFDLRTECWKKRRECVTFNRLVLPLERRDYLGGAPSLDELRITTGTEPTSRSPRSVTMTLTLYHHHREPDPSPEPEWGGAVLTLTCVSGACEGD